MPTNWESLYGDRFGDLAKFKSLMTGKSYGGTAGNDSLTTTDGHDLIRTQAGNDTLYAKNGNDWVATGAGHDRAYAGLGHDFVQGGDGNDSLWGEDGNDQLDGGAGDDRLYGGSGDDQIWDWIGNDRAEGGSGNDTFEGAAGNDSLYGGDGNDLFRDGDGDDLLDGGNGHDTLMGDAGSDKVYGASGDDVLYSGRDGRDLLDGGSGRNIFYNYGRDADGWTNLRWEATASTQFHAKGQFDRIHDNGASESADVLHWYGRGSVTATRFGGAAEFAWNDETASGDFVGVTDKIVLHGITVGGVAVNSFAVFKQMISDGRIKYSYGEREDYYYPEDGSSTIESWDMGWLKLDFGAAADGTARVLTLDYSYFSGMDGVNSFDPAHWLFA